MNSPGVVGCCGGFVTAISSLPRRLVRGLGRGRLLDLFDRARVADLATPVGVDQPAAARHVLRAPAAGLVVRLRARDALELGLLLLADVAAVLAPRLELAP